MKQLEFDWEKYQARVTYFDESGTITPEMLFAAFETIRNAPATQPDTIFMSREMYNRWSQLLGDPENQPNQYGLFDADE